MEENQKIFLFSCLCFFCFWLGICLTNKSGHQSFQIFRIDDQSKIQKYFFSFLFFLLLISIFLIIYLAKNKIFSDQEEKSPSVIENKENSLAVEAQKDEEAPLEEVINIEEKAIFHNQHLLAHQRQKINRLEIDNEKKEIVLGLKNNQSITFVDQENYCRRDNHLYRRDFKMVDLHDNLLNDQEKSFINQYFKKEFDFLYFYLEIFLKLKKFLDEQKKTSLFLLFAFFKSNSLRQQKNDLLRLFDSLWHQEEELNGTVKEFKQKYQIENIAEHDSFINQGRQLINDLIAYKEKSFVFQDRHQKEKQKQKLINFYDYFYKLKDYRQNDRQQIITFLKNKNSLQEISQNVLFSFPGENELKNNDERIFKDLKKDLLFLSSLNVN